jgi:hypothetical protein
MYIIAVMTMEDMVSDMFIDNCDSNPYEPRPLHPLFFNYYMENCVTKAKVRSDRENYCQGTYNNGCKYELSEDRRILENIKLMDSFPITFSDRASKAFDTGKCIPTIQAFKEIDLDSNI